MTNIYVEKKQDEISHFHAYKMTQNLNFWSPLELWQDF